MPTTPRSPNTAVCLRSRRSAVHGGYFAQDKQGRSRAHAQSEFKTKADAEGGTFELIMRDKERLLDIQEPLRFIFSHSALREGWDNPNVFQICTLAETAFRDAQAPRDLPRSGGCA